MYIGKSVLIIFPNISCRIYKNVSSLPQEGLLQPTIHQDFYFRTYLCLKCSEDMSNSLGQDASKY